LTAATITDGLVFREHYRAENVRSTDALKRLRPMPINPKDVGELERALNDAAGKASILWTAFITFELYLAIAFGSVKHRDLFLETPIKLPVLDVNLPLVGFFVVAPTILLIFHFYVFLQLLALTAKAKDYDALLSQATSDISDQNYLRQRLDSFLILQMLVGPTEQRTGFGGLSLRLIAWITLVGTPVLILLQGQVTFLPYHREWVLWLLRVAVLIDLAVIWYFWKRVRSSNEPMVARVPGKSWPIVGAAASVCVFLLSIGIATFPGERQDHVPAIRLIPTNWRPHWSKKDNWTSLHELLFAGAVDEVSGQPRSLFSNRLVLIDQSFVDPDKLVANEISHSYRGRDFSHAVFIRADLRKADFTGAMLNGASFQSSKLQRAHFGCAERGTRTDTKTDHREAAERRWPDDGCTWLQGASLDFAQLQGASLNAAQLQGASLVHARLIGASLDAAMLAGASLDRAQLQGASLLGAQLQGASLDGAMPVGASLDYAQLQGASHDETWLQGASLHGAQLQGASLDRTRLLGASIAYAGVWRVRGAPEIDLTDRDGVDPGTKPWEPRFGSPSSFSVWRDGILKAIPAGEYRDRASERLSALDPTPENEPKNSINSEFWKNASSVPSQSKESIVAVLTDLACSSYEAPYFGRGLLRTARMDVTGEVEAWVKARRSQIGAVAASLRKHKFDQAACLGVKNFTDEDWGSVEELVAAAGKLAPDEKTK
jgi:uncharacterized protein YjbI with pentapeptide repeats